MQRVTQAIVESMPLAAVVCDQHQKIYYINPAAEKLTGWSQNKALLHKCDEVFGISETGCMDSLPFEHIAAGQDSVGEQMLELAPKGGASKKVRAILSRLADSSDKTGVLILLEDITETKHSQRALQKSQQRIRAIINALPDFLFRIDRQGIFLDYHTSDSNQLALPTEEFVGKCVYDVLPETFAHKAMNTMKAAIDSGQVTTFEYRLNVPNTNKTRRDYEARVVAINQTEALYIARDVTEKKQQERERRKLEAQIQHAQKLESLGVLAGGIAHDFNNLLTGVLGNLDLAMVNLPPESPALPLVDKARDTALHLATLTDQMLAYSGRGKFVVQSLDLSRLVLEMQHLLQISVAKNVVLRYELPENLPHIAADASQIRQVIMNLVTNAYEAVGEKSGTVSITTGMMKADRDYLCETYLDENLPSGFYAYLEVSDTGVGMDTTTRHKVFDPFFSTKFTGRGLGLAAVLGIVRGHRGAAKIYSEPGKGTTFKVLFPIVNRQNSLNQGKQNHQIEINMRSGTVLVVDDEETVRAVAKMILERSGFNVLIANDGKEAIRVFDKHQHEIDVVILDLHMPRQAGEQTYREMRLLRPDIPVILSSGYNERDATINFAGKGLAGFVKKPYTVNDLLQKVYNALDSKQTVG